MVSKIIRPRTWYFEDFEVFLADEVIFESGGHTVTEYEIRAQCNLSGDRHPLHVDEVFAEDTPFGGPVASGVLIYALTTGLGRDLGIFGNAAIAQIKAVLQFTGPVYAGDTLTLNAGIVSATKHPKDKPQGRVVFVLKTANQNGVVVFKCTMTVDFRTKPSE